MAARTTRRAVLAGAGSIAALVGTSASALIHAEDEGPDAPLFRLCDAYDQTLEAANAASKPHTVAERAYFALQISRPDLDKEARRRVSGLDQAEPLWQQALDVNGEVIDTLIDTQARTMAGVLAKARVSVREPYEPRLHASTVADLVALGGAHA